MAGLDDHTFASRLDVLPWRWMLAPRARLGGNRTLVGASANGVAVGGRTTFHEVLAPSFVDDMPQGRRTRQSLVQEATAFHAAHADVGFAIEQMLAEGEWVACRVTLRYTDLATGRRVEVWNPFFGRVVDGQLVEGTGYYDRLGVLEQTGKYAGAERGTLV